MSKQAPAGWYPDGSGSQRYWDGAAWTEHIRSPPLPESEPAVVVSDFRNRTFRGTDLRGVDLTGADFSGSTFIDVAWSGRDLSGAVLDDTRFIGGSLTEATLAFTSIRGTRFEGLDLGGASLEGSVVSKAHLSEVNLTAANLTMIRVSDSTINGAKVDRASLRSARIVDSGFNFVHGEAADFSEAVLQDLTWADEDTLSVILPVVNMSGATIKAVTWPGARLDGANFSGASIDHGVFAQANLSDARFADADLSSVVFDGADLSRADFTESYVQDASTRQLDLVPAPRRAHLRDVYMREADLTNAQFNGAILLRCDLSGANGLAAEFQGTRFEECVLDGVRWTEAAPGWPTSDEEARATMFSTFIGDDIALPYVPLEETFDVVQGEETVFRSSSWSDVVANELYNFHPMIARLGADRIPDGFAVSMGGHGMNSYAWTWACSESDLRATVQIARGHVYRDAVDVARRWDEAMRGVSRVFELSRPPLPGILVIEFSDMRRVARWRWIFDESSAPSGASTAPREWKGDHSDVGSFFDAVHTYLQRLVKTL